MTTTTTKPGTRRRTAKPADQPVTPPVSQPVLTNQRSAWNGTLSVLGLTSFGVKTYNTTASAYSANKSFRTVHAGCGVGVRQVSHCAVHGETSDTTRVYETRAGLVVDAHEPPKPDKAISITSFVDPAEVDTTFFGETTYIQPDGATSAAAFAVLHAALVSSGRWAMATQGQTKEVVPRVIRPVGKRLAMTTLAYLDEAYAPPPEVEVTARQDAVALLATLIAQRTEPFALPLNERRAAYIADLEAKADGVEPTTAPAATAQASATGQVDALVAALEAAMAPASKGRGRAKLASVSDEKSDEKVDEKVEVAA